MQIFDFFTRTHVFQDHDFRMKSRTKSFVRDFQRILVLGENFSRANFSGTQVRPTSCATCKDFGVLGPFGTWRLPRRPRSASGELRSTLPPRMFAVLFKPSPLPPPLGKRLETADYFVSVCVFTLPLFV